VITRALELPDARYIATDISAEALGVAADNAKRHGVADRITFVTAPYFGDAAGPFHLVVTNPPYVAESARPTLQPEVADYEPALALFGGDDGLRDIREIVTQAHTRLDADGTLLMEIGYDQQVPVAEVVNEEASFAMVRTRKDLQGHPRVAVIRRRR
jgi:release factor glutamine methyltransferase